MEISPRRWRHKKNFLSTRLIQSAKITGHNFILLVFHRWLKDHHWLPFLFLTCSKVDEPNIDKQEKGLLLTSPWPSTPPRAFHPVGLQAFGGVVPTQRATVLPRRNAARSGEFGGLGHQHHGWAHASWWAADSEYGSVDTGVKQMVTFWCIFFFIWFGSHVVVMILDLPSYKSGYEQIEKQMARSTVTRSGWVAETSPPWSVKRWPSMPIPTQRETTTLGNEIQVCHGFWCILHTNKERERENERNCWSSYFSNRFGGNHLQQNLQVSSAFGFRWNDDVSGDCDQLDTWSLSKLQLPAQGREHHRRVPLALTWKKTLQWCRYRGYIYIYRYTLNQGFWYIRIYLRDLKRKSKKQQSGRGFCLTFSLSGDPKYLLFNDGTNQEPMAR